MKRSSVLLLLTILLTTLAWSTPLVAADRLTDRDVKALVERIDQERDKFQDALDDKVKHSILRGPGGEVDVERYLKDFDDNIDKLKDRLKGNYAASAEVGAVLRQASGIDNGFRQQPPGTKGESEWNRLATDLKALAHAYGTDFPLAPNATVRRMGDGEVASTAESISKSADQLKKALDNDLKKDTTIDKATRQAIVDGAGQMSKDAKTLRDRVKSGNPSSAEAARIFDHASRIQSFLDSHRAPTASGIWNGVAPKLSPLAGAYGLSWPAR
jgi:hypothetical protein